MSGGDDNGDQRISVSLSTLRTEIRLANVELELRLTEKLASTEELNVLRLELTTLRTWVAALDKNFRDAQLQVETTRSTLAGVTEQKRAALADASVVSATFTKRERILALCLAVIGVALPFLYYVSTHWH